MHQIPAMKLDIKKIFFRYKLLHIILWALIGVATFIGNYTTNYNLAAYILQSILVPIFSCIPFYTAAWYFVPKYLYPKKYLLLVLWLGLFIISATVIQIAGIRSLLHIVENRISIIPSKDDIVYIIYTGMWNTLLAIVVGGGLKIIADRFRMEKKLAQTEKEKISTELNFLRSQINPHFLFNVMNTIYFQIDKKNTDARASVEKLSEMLRYQLYECTTDHIELKKEIEYVKNYVQIQSLRMEKGSDVQLYVKGNMNGQKIAPLLILPIVENAFKHVSNFKDPCSNKIHIILDVKDNVFTAEASNTFDKVSHAKHIIQNGGLGVQNLKRRLELLYPGKHKLNIQAQDEFYTTTLILECYD